MSLSFENYMKDMVQPMRDELTRIGVQELRTPEEVSAALDDMKGTTLIVVNSVCGCAAGQCRPGVAKALQHEVKPDRLFTVFAGQDKEATAKAREYFAPYPPSSPSIALMKDGQLVHFIQRHQIEDRSAEMIANDLINAFEEYCK
ncbi:MULTISPECIES: BrxA/BrxB family bacilliredoxin [Paenibacillus]|uniref:Disulfide isomerase n=1 Tax=Paenibacillus naphthalenovorans TaxID=162209 RepID=A0A0U2N091_9BACL|nr:MULTISPECIES: BrxA/BrxB family bacilliredoxin [Paenibacillus]ALS24239.1 disulfide isomerase [Paenibacillus naphthalenovorans]NTZ20341.1 BrxA/BrxB family bacilliredoxin [Paenibacillus sp. JMULE4]GCL73870.1 BrxA/BrxB family bacilliredoxin [Paenibacillus naphthalenovorans]SDI50932.1 putative bacilliredoxin, YphP/YqiW family [Paenibacillus naphthalenovorans]